jgi:hypothetical protein
MQHKTIMRSKTRELVGDTDVVEFTGHFSAKCQLEL